MIILELPLVVQSGAAVGGLGGAGLAKCLVLVMVLLLQLGC